MSLAAGTKLGPYEILAALGAGGMGEVYRAHDPKLNRDVAIKILPEALTADPAAFARFEREAQAVAALSHPNILGIHDFGVEQGIPYAVMELLEGHTLREQLRDIALPPRKAIEHAAQVAHGLAAAHEKGITHRDLKPENLFVTREGRVKILDFGLAKTSPGVVQAFRPAVAGGPEGPHYTPTVAPTMAGDTEPGTVLGTVGYMAPEQVRGQTVDHRADIFALGAILYELLAGRRAFTGHSAVETMNAILKDDPPELTQTNGVLPPVLDRIVRRCLEKNPDERFQSARDLAFALEAISGSGTPIQAGSVVGGSVRAAGRWRGPVLGVMAGAAIATAVFALRPARPLEPHRVVRFAIDVPASRALGTIALAPDGTRLAYVGTEGGQSRIYVRALDQSGDNVLAGTDDATSPFFSPDSQWIAFFAGGRLKKTPAAGGEVISIGDAKGQTDSGTWTGDGTIIFSSGGSGLMRVPSSGGVPVRLTVPDAAKGEVLHLWPSVLPGDRSVLFSVTKGQTNDTTWIDAVSLGTGARTRIIQDGILPNYLPSGHILYVAEGRLVVARFDPSSLKVEPAAVPAVDALGYNSTIPLFTLSLAGDLAYAEEAAATAPELVRVDRRGTVEWSSAVAPETGSTLSLSPDGTRVAVYRTRGGQTSMWIIDVQRGTQMQIAGVGNDHVPLWLPDGSRLVFSSRRGGAANLFLQAVDGGGTAEPLVASQFHDDPGSWSRDGRWLAYAENDPRNGYDLWAYDFPARRAIPFRRTAANELYPALSPDGDWLAYASDESGRREVYAEAFPGGGRRVQLSVDGGTESIWSAKGQEVFYRNAGRLMSVAVKAGPVLSAGAPAVLFEGLFKAGNAFGPPGYAATPDGQHFYFLRSPAATPTARRINVIVNWLEEFKRRVATK